MHSLKDQQLVKNFSYINGSWHSSETNLAVNNPATGELVANVSNAGIAETELAIKAAKSAYKMWSGKSANERAVLMRNWFNLMMEHQDDLGKILTLEQGKPLAGLPLSVYLRPAGPENVSHQPLAGMLPGIRIRTGHQRLVRRPV